MISFSNALRSIRPWTWAVVLVFANSLAVGFVLLHSDQISVQTATASPSNPVSAPALGLGTTPTGPQRPSRLIVVGQSDPTMGAWLVDPQSGAARRITANGEDVSLVAASRDGQELAYVVRTGPELWTLKAWRLDGSSQRTIAADQAGRVVSLAWSPRGDLLAYEVTQNNGAQVGPPRIWLVMADGSSVSLVYGRSQETGSRPVWSPDGGKVSFFENQQHVIAVFDFTPRLTAIPTGINAAWSWSSDSKAIVYTDRADANSPLTVNRVAMLSNPVQIRLLAQGAFSDSLPVWSPIGDWIAFVRLSGTSAGVWLIRPNGTEAHAVHEQPGWYYGAPVWAPDGSALAVSRHPTRTGPLEQQPEVWVVPLQGEARRLDMRGLVAAWVP
jgi:Tol biopolymer transport system component